MNELRLLAWLDASDHSEEVRVVAVQCKLDGAIITWAPTIHFILCKLPLPRKL